MREFVLQLANLLELHILNKLQINRMVSSDLPGDQIGLYEILAKGVEEILSAIFFRDFADSHQ